MNSLIITKKTVSLGCDCGYLFSFSPVSAVHNVSELMQMVFCVVKTAKQPKIAGTATCSYLQPYGVS